MQKFASEKAGGQAVIMEIINRVRVEIGTGRYTISTNEPEEYVLELARGINEKLEEVMGANGTLSQSDALILCLLDYADGKKKSEQGADHIRDQLTGYLEDNAKQRIELDELRAEVTRLSRENELLKKSGAPAGGAAQKK